jgi:hypothetical protein
MIVTSDISPDKNLYFLGGKILEKLSTEVATDSLGIFDSLKADHNISFPLYMYALDWLYTINLIESDENGDITLCSLVS